MSPSQSGNRPHCPARETIRLDVTYTVGQPVNSTNNSQDTGEEQSEDITNNSQDTGEEQSEDITNNSQDTGEEQSEDITNNSQDTGEEQSEDITNNSQDTGEEQSEDITKRTKEEIKLRTGMIHVSAVNTVVRMLKSGRNWVTIRGNAGDGKTTVGFLALQKLENSEKIYHIKKPEEYEVLSRVKGKRVILLDDIFGAFMSDQTLVNKWRDVLTDLDKKCKQAKNKTKVVFVSRKTVLDELQESLDSPGTFMATILDPENVVDLRTNVKKERLKILGHYLKQSNLKESAKVKQMIADLEIDGFPHCCKMYTKLKETQPDLKIQSFFQSPLEFDNTTAVLYSEKKNKDLFQRIIKGNGQFDVNSVKDDNLRKTLLKVVREQKGSYITVWKNGVCEFAHPSIYESLLRVICKTDPLFCVKFASLSVIRQKFTFSDKEMNLQPAPALLKTLAERFQPDILQGDYSVFNHGICDNEDFCKQLLSTCVYSNGAAVPEQGHKRKHIDAPSSDNKTMLWRALLGGKTLAFHALVEHGANVNLPDENGNSPFLFLCKQKVVHFNLTRELVTSGRADCNVKDKTEATTLLYLRKRDEVDSDLIRELVTSGRADCNVKDETGATPLLYLCKRDEVEGDLIRELVTSGRADCNVKDKTGATPLLYLCKRDEVEGDLIRELVTSGRADCNVKDETGATPLLYLCKRDEVEGDLIRELVTSGRADCNVKDETGATPLLYLCKRDEVEGDLIRELVTSGRADCNVKDKTGATPLLYLCKRDEVDSDLIRELVTSGRADCNVKDETGATPLLYLCKRDEVDSDLIRELVTTGRADCNVKDKTEATPLLYLWKRDEVDSDLIRELVTTGRADCNVKDETGATPLLYLCKRDEVDSDLIRELVTSGRADCNVKDETGATPLLYLCKRDEVEGDLIRELVTMGRADCNVKDETGTTPLLYLCKRDEVDSDRVKILITTGRADCKVKDETGATPLYSLCFCKKVHIETLMLMVTKGADINETDDVGATPLHWLSRRSDVSVDDMRRLAVQGHGNINRRDDFGFTPLHYLCTRKVDTESLVSLIQEVGGDLNKTDFYSNTPLHYLSMTNKQGVDHVLKNISGADMRLRNANGFSSQDLLDGKEKASKLLVTQSVDSRHRLIKLGTYKKKWIPVIGPEMILNKERVHSLLQVEGLELTNMAWCGGKNTPDQFKMFRGTISSPVHSTPPPLHSCVTSAVYWETLSKMSLMDRDVFSDPLLQMGVKQGEDNIEDGFSVSYLTDSVCVSVRVCRLHPSQLCIQVLRRNQEGSSSHQVGECVSLPHPTSFVEFTLTFGLVLDVGRGRVAFLDVEKGKLLGKLKMKFTQEVFATFYVNPETSSAVGMRLVSGREISVTDQKIDLIQQALSD